MSLDHVQEVRVAARAGNTRKSAVIAGEREVVPPARRHHQPREKVGIDHLGAALDHHAGRRDIREVDLALPVLIDSVVL